MQIGVYGCGYLGTVVSACLADFGVPVTCYSDHHEAVLKLAEGNIPFHEKNLAEVARRNLRAGRLIYSTDLESFARRSHIMYIAEDSPEHLAQICDGRFSLAPMRDDAGAAMREDRSSDAGIGAPVKLGCN